jgi:hypothetical protein
VILIDSIRRDVLATLNVDGAVGTVHTVQTAPEAHSHAPFLAMAMNLVDLQLNLPALADFRAV